MADCQGVTTAIGRTHCQGCRDGIVLREERNQAEEQERDLAADVRDLKAVLGDCERFMSALVEMWRNDMAGDRERGMARFNSGGFVETIRAAREALK